MNISKVSLMTPSRNVKRLAAAALMTVGVLAGASAATKVNNKNNNVTPPTNVEETKKEETKKENPFKDLFIDLAMGTAVIGGAGVLLAKGEKEKAEMLNQMFARHTYKDSNGDIVTETKE